MSKTVNDVQLGPLEWEPSCGWWSGFLKPSDNQQVELHISTPANDELTITDQARRALSKVMNADQLLRQKACDELLAIHNDSWNEAEPIDAETFKRRLRLESVSIYPDGSAEIYYGDDDMFWGHVIIVSMSAAGEFTDATIAG